MIFAGDWKQTYCSLSLSSFLLALWWSLVFNKLRKVAHKMLNSSSLIGRKVGRSHWGQPALWAAELKFPPFPVGACAPGLPNWIWNLVRKPQWYIFRFWGTFSDSEAHFWHVGWEYCRQNFLPVLVLEFGRSFIMEVTISAFPLSHCSPVLMYFHLYNVGIFFMVLALWFSGKPQNNTEERSGKKPLGERDLHTTLVLLKGKLISVLNGKLKHNKRWLGTWVVNLICVCLARGFWFIITALFDSVWKP